MNDTQNWHTSCLYLSVITHKWRMDNRMDVQLLRIDSRLLHGQVTTSWARALSIDYILVVSDAVAHDKIRKALMLQVKPANVNVKILTLAKMERLLQDSRFDTLKVMILVESPIDALTLIQKGLSIYEINIGSLSFQTGSRMITNTVSVTPEDILAFKALHQKQIALYTQKVATDAKKDFWSVLSDKLKQSTE